MLISTLKHVLFTYEVGHTAKVNLFILMFWNYFQAKY